MLVYLGISFLIMSFIFSDIDDDAPKPTKVSGIFEIQHFLDKASNFANFSCSDASK